MERRAKPRLLFAHAPGHPEGQLDPVCHQFFEIIPAGSFSAACQAAKQSPFSLILVDEGLLHGKAIPLCEELKRCQSAPILLQVMGADPRFLEHAFAAGAQDFIMSPANPQELRARGRLARSARTLSERVMGLVSRLTDLSRRDSLTKLFNRSVLEEWLMEAIQSNRPFHLLMLDIDHFKGINDTLGHAAGDTVLVEISKLLQKQLRHSDLVVRYGGEEFVVLIDGDSARNAYAVAEKIRGAVEHANLLTLPAPHKVTVSIGLLSVDPSAPSHRGPRSASATALMKKYLIQADRALYAAKKQGRNRVVRASRQGVSSKTSSKSK